MVAACGWWACKAGLATKGPGSQEAGAPEGPSQKQAKGPKKNKKVLCEVGVQGPVHYTGVGQEAGGRYLHECQGFRRSWEVARVVADQPRPHQE